ncbi:MAG: hypothetical protein CME33_09470 [Gimesia sp.]|uniref:HEAT repeat domain-containing protein n=1 Tax=Gimesia sp. TaxID=2024833 RepID=UPI000C623EFF|nr:HEAT repeat domain-containing protein [Gimesia sp.]MAX36778.1 hypothetical protein [Gimesia sp.]
MRITSEVEAQLLKSLHRQLENLENAQRERKIMPGPSRENWARIGIGYGTIMLFVILGFGCFLNGESNQPIENAVASEFKDASSMQREMVEAQPQEVVLTRYHTQSAKLLREASVAAVNYDKSSPLSALKQSRQLMQRGYLLADIAVQQAAVADITGVEETLSRLHTLNEAKIAGTRLGADESLAIIALAVAYARVGDLAKASQTLQSLINEESVVIARRQEVLSKGYAEVCIALAEEGKAEESTDFLSQFERICREFNDVNSRAMCLAQLARAQISTGQIDRSLGTVKQIQQLANVSAMNEALATVAVVQSEAGFLQEAQSTIDKIRLPSTFADTARFEQSRLHARTLNFRDALVIASKIQDEFLKTRALFFILACQLDCGSVFEESALKLVRLTDKMRDGFRHNTVLHQQLRCDDAVAATKWDLAAINHISELSTDLIQRTIQVGRVARAANATLDVFEALNSDLSPLQKVSIRVSSARTHVLLGESDTARDQLSQALDYAKVEEMDGGERNGCLQKAGKAYADNKLERTALELIGNESDTFVRAAMLLGLAKGLFEREELSRSAEEGILSSGCFGRTPGAHIEGHQFWREFLATVPDELAPSGKPNHLRIEGKMQLLAVPTRGGMNLAIPPTLAGLKAWVVIAAQSVFSREEATGLASFVESSFPIGSEKTIGRFIVRKSLCLRPNGWLVFTLKTVDDGSAPSSLSAQEIFSGRSITAWVKALSSENSTERNIAIAQFSEIGMPAIAPLLECFASNESTTRSAAAEALAKIGEPAVPSLRSALSSRNPQVVGSACDAIGKIGRNAADVVPDLIAVMKRDSQGFWGYGFTSVNISVRSALKKIGKPSVKPLIVLLNSEKGPIVLDTISTLEDIGPDAEESIPALTEVLRTQNILCKTYAAHTLGTFGAKSKEAVPYLIRALSESHSPLRENSAEALGRIGPDAVEALSQLGKRLDDDDKNVRQAAAKAIDLINRPDNSDE